MIGLFARVAPALTLVFALLIGAIRAQPYNDGDLRVLLGEGECWQDICIDVTSTEDALRVLQAHPWVGEVFERSPYISWSWSGSQPRLINSAEAGLLEATGGVVRRLRVQTIIPFGDIWIALNRPNDALLVRPVSSYSVYQIAFYENEGFRAITTIRCPIDPDPFWQAITTLGFGDLWTTEAINGIRFDIYHTSSWWGNLRRCRT